METKTFSNVLFIAMLRAIKKGLVYTISAPFLFIVVLLLFLADVVYYPLWILWKILGYRIGKYESILLQVVNG